MLMKNIVAHGSVICGRISPSWDLSSKHQSEYHGVWNPGLWAMEIILFSPKFKYGKLKYYGRPAQ